MKTNPVSSAANPPVNLVDRYLEKFGDLLFDLSEAVIWDSSHAPFAFRSILKTLRNQGAKSKSNPYVRHERAWVLRIACERLRELAPGHARKVTPKEQLELDSKEDLPHRLKKMDFYFHRLSVEDQILLLLHDKHGLPYDEISAAMNLPEGSLKIRRQQALRTLEEWLWGRP